MTEKIIGRKLTELHGLNHAEFSAEIENELGAFSAASNALRGDLFRRFASRRSRDFRALQIEEFAGEKALICTCFGVSEDTIQKMIAENRADTVEDVGDLCNAGTGCGSCRFLIQELIDIHELEN